MMRSTVGMLCIVQKVMCVGGSHPIEHKEMDRISSLDPTLKAAYDEVSTTLLLRAMPDFIPCSSYAPFPVLFLGFGICCGWKV